MNIKLVTCLAAVIFFSSCGNKGSGVVAKNAALVPGTMTVPPTKPIVNVYLENSVSMFGYINSGNDFDRSISSIITNIKVSGLADSINLFYINSRTFKQNVDIPTFIRRTNTHNAQTWPGNKGRTDMCALFDTVLSNVSNGSISIFVSECIFSPGKGEDAKRYLGAQKDCITMTVNQKLKSQNLAFIVYRMISDFSGSYFDCQDNPTIINDKRPYFIWIIGEQKEVALFKQKIPVSKIEGQFENSYTISKSENNNSYAVQLNPTIGEFERSNPTSIKKVKKDRDSGKFMFSIAVNFSSLLVDESYLTDSQNYNWGNPNYNIEISKKRTGSFTHLIKVYTTAKIISPTILTIQLKNNIPSWVDAYSDETCENITSVGMIQKTYGLKQIIQGIYAAYNYEDEVLTAIKISIN